MMVYVTPHADIRGMAVIFLLFMPRMSTLRSGLVSTTLESLIATPLLALLSIGKCKLERLYFVM